MTTPAIMLSGFSLTSVRNNSVIENPGVDDHPGDHAQRLLLDHAKQPVIAPGAMTTPAMMLNGFSLTSVRNNSVIADPGVHDRVEQVVIADPGVHDRVEQVDE